MKINYKKSLKLVTLLITSLLIATVSAEVYRYMYIYGTITVGSPKLIWLEGEDVTAVIVDTINLLDSTDFSSDTLAPGKYLRFTIEVKAIKNDISRNFVVQVEYW